MYVSIIICTYRRSDDVVRLLRCLDAQTHRRFEVLVVDGSGPDGSVRQAVAAVVKEMGNRTSVRTVQSAAGLTRQRNIGLKNSQGDVVCFLDDDVTVGPDFLSNAVELLDRQDLADVGGVSGYDTVHYCSPITSRWRLRRLLGSVTTLQPGHVDRLGRNVPLSFLKPFSGLREVGWLPGFCMIYRREALAGLTFDEQLPTYGGEDRDFSSQVGRQWRLVVCGDLHLEHHASPNHRVRGAEQVYQTAFGLGRGFARRAGGVCDYLAILRYVLAEFFVDLLSFTRRPSRGALLAAFARPRGIFVGLRSLRRTPA